VKKKTFIYLCAFLLFFSEQSNIFAQEKVSQQEKKTCNKSRFLSEANFFLFRPTGRVLKKTFGKNWAHYQFKCLIMINPYDVFWKNFYVWFGINYLTRNGRVIGGDEKTHIEMTPFLAGLRYDYCAIDNWLHLTADAGLNYYFVRIENNSPLVDNVRRSVPGGMLQVGASFIPYKRTSINLFFNYTFGNLERSINKYCDSVRPVPLGLSGLNFGVGLGFYF